jgi:pimeloyl-ACP methyl ester carboxylesterase
MADERIHRTTSDDGTEIVGRVHGTGPPLVLVHGGLEDGDTCWGPLLPFLTRRFTCYTPSTRGRGLSGQHPDLSPHRLVDDVAAFVDSIGEPVALFGESAGGVLALGAAARTSAVAAVAAYEPPAPEALGEDEAALLADATARIAALAATGNLVDAADIFASLVVNDNEAAAPAFRQHVADNARYVTVLLQEIQQGDLEPEAASPTDPATLRRITAPVLLLRGPETALRWHSDGVDHVARHVADHRVREIPGAGHAGVTLSPQAVSDELVTFLRRPVS